MIKDNRIIFGYGDILVGSYKPHSIYMKNLSTSLVFYEIKPPKEIGKMPEEGSYDILNTLSFNLTTNDISILENIRNVLKTTNRHIKFRDYILDFSNYNEESVKVVIEGFENALFINELGLAC